MANNDQYSTTNLTISASLFTHDNTDYRSNYRCITIHTQQYLLKILFITLYTKPLNSIPGYLATSRSCQRLTLNTASVPDIFAKALICSKSYMNRKCLERHLTITCHFYLADSITCCQ